MSATEKEHLSIVVAGHVDHGKSTVIGRLLADTGALPEGKLESIRELCRRTAKPFEYAFLLDALKDERAQGITIDTARCFFETEKRRCTVIDAPGHIEFLKNMISGASRADAALLVIDAAEGVCENSRRHGYMLEMLGISAIAVLVNKIDLVNYDRGTYEAICRDYSEFLATIGITPTAYIPVSAAQGDNIASHSERTPWYSGPDVLETLDLFPCGGSGEGLPLRIPVEDVYKFTGDGDTRRIVAGLCESGSLGAGERVVFYPSGKTAVVKTLEEWFMDGNEDRAPTRFYAGKSCGFTTEEQIYVRRGEIACRAGETPPKTGRAFRASIFWLGKTPLVSGREYVVKACTAKTPCRITAIHSSLNAASLEKTAQPLSVGRHEIADCTFVCEREIAFDTDASLPATGRFVIVDGYEISGGGIITEALKTEEAGAYSSARLTKDERAKYMNQRPLTVGVPDEETGRLLERALFAEGRFAYYAPRLSDEQKNALLSAGLIVLTQGDGEVAAAGEEDIGEILIRSQNALELGEE